MKFNTLLKRLRWGALLVILAAIYYGAARLGQSMAIPPGNVTTVWPPSGIALASIRLLGYRIWPGLWLGSVLGNTWAFFDPTNEISILKSIAVGASIGVGETLQACLSAFLLQRFVGSRNPFNRSQDVLKFIVLSGMLATVFSATIGVTSLCLGGFAQWAEYGYTWYTWWLGDTTGVLVVAPLLLSWSHDIFNFRFLIVNWRRLKRDTTSEIYQPLNSLKSTTLNSQWAEAILLLLLVLVVGKIAFGGGYPVEYMLIPFLIWTAFRFGQQGATLLIVLISGIAIWGTVKGFGPFARPNLNESLFLLQSFIGVVVLTTLLLAALLAEQQLAESTLRQSESQLREQAQQLENTLRELRQTQSKLIQTERMSSLGQLVAGVAHEINNPINFIRGNIHHAQVYIQDLLNLLQVYQQHYPQPKIEVQTAIEAIELDYLVEDLPKLLSSIKIGSERIQKIILSLRNFSRLDESDIKAVDIHEGINSTLLIVQHRLKAKAEHPGIQVIKEYGQLPLVECYAGWLNQVFMNLLENAIDALEFSATGKVGKLAGSPESQPASPTIWISTQVREKNSVVIRIADNGQGMTEDVQKRMFDPFFTTKPIGKGTGLGLSISYQIIVEKHRGSLNFTSTPGQGTEFIIEIPIQQRRY